MKMHRILLLGLAIAVAFWSCSKEAEKKETWKTLDLLPHGLPVAILAPDSAVVSVTKVGLVEDVSVRNRGTEHYSLQIYVQPVITSDMPALKSNQIQEVKSTAEFQKIEEEDEQSFVFSMRMGDEVYYSFRYIHLQADKEYVFTTGFNERFTLEETKRMLAAVRQ